MEYGFCHRAKFHLVGAAKTSRRRVGSFADTEHVFDWFAFQLVFYEVFSIISVFLRRFEEPKWSLKIVQRSLKI